jgi:hypothetical protein
MLLFAVPVTQDASIQSLEIAHRNAGRWNFESARQSKTALTKTVPDSSV